MKTIIYLTDSVLDESIARPCREQLKKAAGENRIISVSQKPLDLGTNVCVGEIGRSWLNIYKQQLEGLKLADTKYVAIAEHDVMYTQEHFDWTPPRDDTFYYNDNCWLVQWGGNHPEMNGMYSRWSKNRYALSQLVCDRELLISSIEERLQLIESGIEAMRKLGEPGAFNPEAVKLAKLATNGRAGQLQGLLREHLAKFRSEAFNTVNPNLDIRHGGNFTGARRGHHRTYDLKPWGDFSKIMI